MNAVALQEILTKHNVWQGKDWQHNHQQHHATGQAWLDDALHGGWPQGQISELYCQHQGIGELCLLMPTLAQLSQQKRWILLVAPPHIPFAPAWEAYGVNRDRVLMLGRDYQKQSYAMVEKALRYGCYSAILAWPEQQNAPALRRLQLAAEQSQTSVWLFQQQAYQHQSSYAAVRAEIRHDGEQPQLQLHKRPQGWPLAAKNLHLDPLAGFNQFA